MSAVSEKFTEDQITECLKCNTVDELLSYAFAKGITITRAEAEEHLEENKAERDAIAAQKEAERLEALRKYAEEHGMIVDENGNLVDPNAENMVTE